MNTNIECLYSFANVSSTLRVIRHLRNKYQSYLNSVAVINLADRWLVKVCLKSSMPYQLSKNLRAFLAEMGTASQATTELVDALAKLEAGESPTTIMNRYRVVIVAYGKPEIEEIEIFRDRIVKKLGYCPQNMM